MSYLFYNNWPYDYTVFPTMEDHLDAVNNSYFTGLHTEIENIENCLGLDPEGPFDTVKARLDDIENKPFQPILLTPELAQFGNNEIPVKTQINGSNTSYYKITFDKALEKFCCWVTPVTSKYTPVSLKITVYYKSTATVGVALCRAGVKIHVSSSTTAFPGAGTYIQEKLLSPHGTSDCLTFAEFLVDSVPADISSMIMTFTFERWGQDGTDTLDADLDLLGIKVEKQ